MGNSTRRTGALFGVPAFFVKNLSTGIAANQDAPGLTPAHMLFAATMIGLGIIGLVYGDFALVWQRIPIAYLPGRTFFAYVCAAIELATGIGLLVQRTVRLSARVLVIYLLL